MTFLRVAILLLTILLGGTVPAFADCVPPERPFLPESQDDMRTYAALIRADFEAYVADVQDYFRCADEERARVFAEAREVSDDYGRFVGSVE